MFRYIPFILFLLFNSAFFSDIKSQTYEDYYSSGIYSYSFSTDNDSHIDEVAEYFISEIALSNNTLNSYSAFNIDYLLEKKAYYKNGTIIIITIQPRDLTGSTLYRSYDVSGLLMPTGVHFNLLVFNEHKRIILRKKVNLHLNQDGYFAVKYRLNNACQIQDIRTQNLRFTYTEKRRSDFDNITDFIDQYYAFLNMVNHSIEIANKVNFSNKDDFSGNLIKYFDLKNLFLNISGAGIQDSLDIYNYDPENFNGQIRKFGLRVKRIHTLLLSEFQQSGNGKLKYRAFNFRASVKDLLKDYIAEVHTASYKEYDAFKRYLSRNFSNSYLAEINSLIRHVRHSYPGLRNSRLSGYLTKLLLTEFIYSTDYCIKQGLYNEAFLILSLIENFCYKIPFYCDNEVYRARYARASYGLYNSYLRIAEKAMINYQFSLAKDYIIEAEEFQAENTGFIITKDQVLDAYKKFYKQNLEFLDSLLSQERIREAEKNLNLLLSLSDRYPLINSENIWVVRKEKIIRLKKYLLLLRNVEKHYYLKNYEGIEETLKKAEVYYEDKIKGHGINAEKISDSSIVKQCNDLVLISDSLIRTAYNEEALGILVSIKIFDLPDDISIIRDSLLRKALNLYVYAAANKGLNIIQNGNMQSAGEVFIIIDSMISRSGEKLTVSVNKKLEDFRELFLREDCANLSEKYRRTKEEAEQVISEGDFKRLEKIISDFKETLNNSRCSSVKEKDYSLEKYEPVMVYCKMKSALEAKMYESGFTAIIEEYIMLDDYYYKEDIHNYLDDHTDFIDFLEMQQSISLMVNSMNYLIEMDYPYVALNVLQLLKEQGYPSGKLKVQQQNLATLVFKKDIAAKRNNFSENLNSYTNGGEFWYRSFSKEYKKLYKQLN